MTTKHPFRFGLMNESMLPRRAWQDHARRVEDAGYNIFLMRDHHVPDFFGDSYAPFSALMSAADATSHLHLGTLVICNDFRHPADLAKECATLDLLSDGRFELGIGAGWLLREYQLLGLPYDKPGTRIGRLEASVQLIKQLWAAGAATQHSAFYNVDGLDGFPKPFGGRSIPVLIGGGQQRILTMAGREANIVGFLTTQVGTGVVVDDPMDKMPEAIDRKLNWVRAGAGDRFADIELSSFISLVITDDRVGATDAFRKTRGWDHLTNEMIWSMPSVAIGTVSQIADDLLAHRERFGFSYIVVTNDHLESFAPVVARLAGTVA